MSKDELYLLDSEERKEIFNLIRKCAKDRCIQVLEKNFSGEIKKLRQERKEIERIRNELSEVTRLCINEQRSIAKVFREYSKGVQRLSEQFFNKEEN